MLDSGGRWVLGSLTMTSRGVRGVVVASAALVALAAPGAAWACIEPSAGPDGGIGADGLPSGGPNSPVPFVLTSDEGAEYEVEVGGTIIDTGEDLDGASGYHGVFSMPDLGGVERVVWVTIRITHTEHTDPGLNVSKVPSTFRVRYTPPPVPAAPSDPQAPAASPPAPAQSAPQTLGTEPRSPTGTSPGSSAGGGPPSPGPGAPPELGGGGSTPAAPNAPSGAPAEPARASAGTAMSPVEEAREPSRGVARARAEAAPPPLLHPRRREPPVAVRAERPVTAANETDGLSAWWIVALAAVVLVGIGGFGLRRLRVGTPPPLGTPPPPGATGLADPVEAELQEIVAEERARQVAREAARIRSGPG
jgi:hypothetical protein